MRIMIMMIVVGFISVYLNGNVGDGDDDNDDGDDDDDQIMMMMMMRLISNENSGWK